jgi:hypothetical protein
MKKVYLIVRLSNLFNGIFFQKAEIAINSQDLLKIKLNELTFLDKHEDSISMKVKISGSNIKKHNFTIDLSAFKPDSSVLIELYIVRDFGWKIINYLDYTYFILLGLFLLDVVTEHKYSNILIPLEIFTIVLFLLNAVIRFVYKYELRFDVKQL